MSIQVTNKSMRELYSNIIIVPCNMLDRLFSFRPAKYYNAGTYGWNCDYITLEFIGNYDTLICTGYRPIKGTHKADYELCKEYEDKAVEIIRTMYGYKDIDSALNELIKEFINKILEV